jgi:hypothetical protein
MKKPRFCGAFLWAEPTASVPDWRMADVIEGIRQGDDVVGRLPSFWSLRIPVARGLATGLREWFEYWPLFLQRVGISFWEKPAPRRAKRELRQCERF